MKLILIDGHLINPELICYIDTDRYQTLDVYFAGRKKPLDLDKEELLAKLESEGLLEEPKRTKPQERPPLLPIEQGTNPGYTGLWGTGIQPKQLLDILSGEESDE